MGANLSGGRAGRLCRRTARPRQHRSAKEAAKGCRRRSAGRSAATACRERLPIFLQIKSLAEFAPPQQREKDPIRFLRRRVRRKKHPALASAQRNWPRQTRRLMSGQSVFLRAMRAKMRGSERKLFKKGVPFFEKLKTRITRRRRRLRG